MWVVPKTAEIPYALHLGFINIYVKYVVIGQTQPILHNVSLHFLHMSVRLAFQGTPKLNIGAQRTRIFGFTQELHSCNRVLGIGQTLNFRIRNQHKRVVLTFLLKRVDTGSDTMIALGLQVINQ